MDELLHSNKTLRVELFLPSCFDPNVMVWWNLTRFKCISIEEKPEPKSNYAVQVCIL
jgi:dTDP-glucose pyrophosphorylase